MKTPANPFARSAGLLDADLPYSAAGGPPIVGQQIQLGTSRQHCIGAYLARADGTPKGGLVVVQEIFGVNAHMRSVVDRFAQSGYTSLPINANAATRSAYIRVRKQFKDMYFRLVVVHVRQSKAHRVCVVAVARSNCRI
jgi:hypothetical protein